MRQKQITILIALILFAFTSVTGQQNNKKGLKDFVDRIEKKVNQSEQKNGSNANKKSGTTESWKIKAGTVTSDAYQKLMMDGIKNKKPEQVKRAIELGANPNFRTRYDKYPNEPLIAAIDNGCVECADILAPLSADINIGPLDRIPVIEACSASEELCRKCVLEWGANPFVPNIIPRCMGTYIKYDGYGSIVFLLSKGVKIDPYKEEKIYYASNRTLKLVLDNGLKLDDTTLGGFYADKKYDTVDLLLQYDVEMNGLAKNGKNILEYAISLNDTKYVKKFLEHGSDPNKCKCLEYAIERGANQQIIDLLIEYGAK